MKKWFKTSKLPVADLEIHACPNCDQEFQGYYCPSCGQSATEFDRPMGFVFYDFMGNFFSFDSRFFHTFRDLLLRPGFLTVEFFKGRRARYAPPLRIFIFLSFFLFLLLEIWTNKGLKQVLDAPLPGLGETITSDSIQKSLSDSASQKEALVMDKDTSGTVSGDVDINGMIVTLGSGNIRESMLSVASRLEEKLGETTDQSDREQLINMINIIRSPDHLVASMLKYLSWASFILLPLFALFLKLFYFRQKVYYIRHLVFSVHLHSFMFLLLGLVLAINLLFPGATGLLSLWLLWVIPVYIYMASLRFYKQGYMKTLVKFLMLATIYSIILTVILVIVFTNALVFNIA